MPKMTRTKLEKTLTQALSLKSPVFHLTSTGGRWSGSVISEMFRGIKDHSRQSMIWDALDEAYGPESVKVVGMLLAYTPEEWNIGSIAAAKAAKDYRQKAKAG